MQMQPKRHVFVEYIVKRSSSSNLIGLDLLRIVAAIAVYLFHLNIHFNFRTGVYALDTSISVSAIFMVCFFMLSGFVLSYRYGSKELLTNTDALKSYYKKRLLRILPAYFLFLMIVFLFRLSWPNDSKLLTLLVPVDILGIQAFFPKAFNFFGNGGTWFVSVLLFLYFLFPLLQRLTNMVNRIWLPILFCYLLIVHISLMRVFAGGEFALYYANPVFRIPEFFIGMLLGKNQAEKPLFDRFVSTHTHVRARRIITNLFVILSCVIAAIIYVLSITYLFNKKVWGVDFYKTNYLSYNVIAVPLFILVILLLSNFSWHSGDITAEKSGVLVIIRALVVVSIDYLSRLSFYFYLTQTFANRLVGSWMKTAHWGVVIAGDKEVLLFSMILNAAFAIAMMTVVEKVLNPALKKVFY